MQLKVIRRQPDPTRQTVKRDWNSGFTIEAGDIIDEDLLIEEGWDRDVVNDIQIIKKSDNLSEVDSIVRQGDGVVDELPGEKYEVAFQDERDDLIIPNGTIKLVEEG